jgi:transcriptional regulator with XRE-family HTH domain
MKSWTKIRDIRKNLGLTQKEFAEMLGVTQNHLSNIEKGDRGLTLEMAEKICDYFDLSLDWLIRDRGEPPTRVHIVEKYETMQREMQGLSAV